MKPSSSCENFTPRPDDESIVTSTNRGEVAVLDRNSLAGRCFGDIARRLLGEDVPLLVLEEKQGVLSQFFGRFRAKRS